MHNKINLQLPKNKVIQLFLKEIQKCPRISRKEEISLSKNLENAEIELWEILLSYNSLYSSILTNLKKEIPFRIKRLDLLLKSTNRKNNPNFKENIRNFVLTTRTKDTDRKWMNLAIKIARFNNDDNDKIKFNLSNIKVTKNYYNYIKDIDIAFKKQLEIKNKFVNANLKFALMAAKSLYKNTLGPLTIEDLIQEGNIGLIKSVEKFNYRVGVKFTSYAAWWVRHHINRSYIVKHKIVKFPVKFFQDYSSYNKILEKNYTKNGNNKDDNPEIANIKKKLEEIKPYLGNERFEYDDHNQYENHYENNENNYIKNNSITYINNKISNILNNKLTPLELSVIRYRFGFNKNNIEYTLKQIGDNYNLSRERIRQIEEDTLKKIKKYIVNSKDLKTSLEENSYCI